MMSAYAPSEHASEVARIKRACTRFLPQHYPRSPKATLAALAERTPDELDADRYGLGGLIADFEAEIAALLGKPAAVFMPSGTMAQPIAMRLWSVERGKPVIGYHPTCHLEIHEHKAYSFLHGMRSIEIGSPVRLFTLGDLRAVKDDLGALLIELPQREIGGQLWPWDELLEITAYARERGIPIHMDGARLWEAGPFYGKPYAEICAPFDSVYVSFYKGIGGIAGSILAGPEPFVDAARIWQRRSGGNLIALYPYVLSAKYGLADHLPKMPLYVDKARRIAARLSAIEGITVSPNPPQTNMLHIFLRGDRERIEQKAFDIARTRGLWLFENVGPTEIPGVFKRELSTGDATLDIDDAEIAAVFAELVAAGRS